MSRWKLLFGRAAATLLFFSVVTMVAVDAQPSEPAEPKSRIQAWTLEEALTQLRLYPRDSYLQYVSLQLARREGQDELKRVASFIVKLDPQSTALRESRRRERVDLFRMTTGALAVQESLQLDAMTDFEITPEISDLEIGYRFQGSLFGQENLLEIGGALFNYQVAVGHYPTSASYDSQGKQLLSWRVHLLPHLGQTALYEQFHHDEPWDSPHNKTLIARMPEVYGIPAGKAQAQYRTRYLVPVGAATLFAGKEALNWQHVKDGTDNTIMVVEAAPAKAVIWTKPDDFHFDETSPQSGLAGITDGWLHVLMADGSVRSLPSTMEPKLLSSLYTPNGGEAIDWQAVYAHLPAESKKREPATIPITVLTGPTVRSHAFEEMLAGKQPAVSSLAMAVPKDFYYIRSRKITKLLELANNADLWAAHLFSQSVHQARSHQSFARTQAQLCVPTTEALGSFYDLVVSEVAITGSDLFLRQGSDVTVLFRFANEQVFRKQMDQFLEIAVKEDHQVRRSTDVYRNVSLLHLTTPDRHIHVYSAYPKPGLHIRSNSYVALKRVIDTLKHSQLNQGEQTARPLGSRHEFQYMRTLFEKDAAEEDVFVYLSDPFIRRLVGPVKKVTTRRRLICYNYLRMLGHAAMMYRTETGEASVSLAQLRDTDCLPPSFGKGRLACPDGGEYRLSPDGTEGECSVHGRARAMTPCCEIAATHVTPSEHLLYRRFLSSYNSYWGTFFDPIGIRIQVSPETYRLETIVLPLLDNTIYSNMALVLGGAPVPLDCLPVAQRDILSVAAKYDKSQLISMNDDELSLHGLVDDLQQIGLAFHNYHDVYRCFPPASDKESGLSWRVHLLPYLEQWILYERFHLDEPWDSPHNKTLLDAMPPVYGSEGSKTRILGFSGEGAPMGQADGIRLRDVRDGSSNTLFVVRAGADQGIPWTKPEDLKYPVRDVTELLGQVGEDAIPVLMMDGNVRMLRGDVSVETLNAMITHRGGEDLQTLELTDAPSRPLLHARDIEYALSDMGVLPEDVRELRIQEFLVHGLGDEVSFHICDSEPTFSFSLPRFIGLVARLSGGEVGAEVIAPVLFISSIDAPVYVAISVRDCDVVDRFLSRLDRLLAKASRMPTDGDILSVETDFYVLSDADQRVRCFAIGAFGLRFRVFAARIDKALYVASQPFVLHDLSKQYTTGADPKGVRPADTAAHLLVRIRPHKWSRVLDDYRLGWAEGNRRSCLHNLGPLNGFARAYDLPSDRLLDVAEQLNGVRYFCPEGGQYHWVPADAGAPGRMSCTIHGSASHPRQPAAPLAGSRIDQLLAELKGMTAALTFTGEGLRAVLRIERKSPDR